MAQERCKAGHLSDREQRTRTDIAAAATGAATTARPAAATAATKFGSLSCSIPPRLVWIARRLLLLLFHSTQAREHIPDSFEHVAMPLRHETIDTNTTTITHAGAVTPQLS